MNRSPIFVVGTSRSGTTLTTEILGRHSQVSTRGSIGLLRRIDAVRRSAGGRLEEAAAREAVLEQMRAFYAEYPDPPVQADLERLIGSANLSVKLLSAPGSAEMSRIFLDAEVAQARKLRWARHSTGSLFDLPGIFAEFPDARVILCVRQPLDYLVSYRDSFKRAARRHRVHEVERLRRLYHPVVTSLLWVASMRAARAAIDRYPDRVLLSRYEDLVADAKGSVRRICAFVGCEFEGGMLEIDRNNSSENVGDRGIFSSSVGRWQKSLSATDAYIAQKICAGEMRRLGYQCTPLRPRPADVVWRVMTTPLFAWRALRADRRRRTFRFPAIARRVAALVRG